MMRFDLAGYLIFAFVTAITPGPNNYMLFTHGKNFGFTDARKLMAGIFFGFLVMLYISGYGMSELLLKNNTVGFILKIISSIWLLYLAFVLSNLSSENSSNSISSIGFYKAFFMQFINPKAWIMAITGAAAFRPSLGNMHLNVSVFAFIFGLVGIPCMIIWIKFGDLITTWIKSERLNKAIGITIFFLMVSSVIMIWI